MATDGLSGIAAEKIRNELARVLASPTFATSERHRHFLSFVVEETLKGRADRIKAYTIATCVFGRSEDFDPQQDSIVRIEAGRLRRQLEHYYLTEGTVDAVRIVIPKGTYVPQFESPGDATEAAVSPAPSNRTPRVRSRGPRVFVAPFEQDPLANDCPGLASALTRQIIMGLTRFSTLFVYGADTAFAAGGHAGLSKHATDFDYVVTGTVGMTGSQVTVDLLLQERPEGRYVWAERLERECAPFEIARVRDEIAADIVQELAQPYGILFSRSLDHEEEMPERLGSYSAVLDYYRLIRNHDPDSFGKVLRELEDTVEADPNFAEAFACLSMLITHGADFGTASDRVRPIEEATSLARRAIVLAPNSGSAYRALAMACWFGGDTEESLSAYHTALALNPNDSGIMADLGLRYAMQMDWERAMPLSQEAFRRNPSQPTIFRMGPFLFHFFQGRHEKAQAEARKMEARDHIYTQLARAAAAAELGCKDEASTAVSEIERIFPGYGSRITEDLRSRNFHPDLIAAITASVRKAGLRGLTDESNAPAAKCGDAIVRSSRSQ